VHGRVKGLKCLFPRYLIEGEFGFIDVILSSFLVVDYCTVHSVYNLSHFVQAKSLYRKKAKLFFVVVRIDSARFFPPSTNTAIKTTSLPFLSLSLSSFCGSGR
jgi:hypothetical protein